VPTGANLGTVVAFDGGGGTKPASSVGSEFTALRYYLAHNLEIVQIKWDSDWEAAKSSYLPADPYGNIQDAACRPAGFLHFVYTSPTLFQAGGGMCAHGFSAGSATVVYSLAWYGAGWGSTGYIDNVELLSGPVLTRVDTGCQNPVAPNVTVCQGAPGCRMQSGVQPWSVSPEYVGGDENYLDRWSNIYACANSSSGNTTPWNGVWQGMSILSSSITPQQLSYPSTSMNAWLCGSVYNNEEPMNNTSAQGWLFYQQASWYPGLPAWVNAVTSCNGPEGVYGSNATAYDGIPGNAGNLIVQDMVAHCVLHH
jgi:hypothetical protein